MRRCNLPLFRSLYDSAAEKVQEIFLNKVNIRLSRLIRADCCTSRFIESSRGILRLRFRFGFGFGLGSDNHAANGGCKFSVNILQTSLKEPKISVTTPLQLIRITLNKGGRNVDNPL